MDFSSFSKLSLLFSFFIAGMFFVFGGCQPADTNQAVVEIEAPKENMSPIVKLEIEESAKVARERCPLTVGVPFAKGMVPDASLIRIFAPSGDAIPLQSTALSRWSDGSVKWGLFDFQMNIEAGKKEFWEIKLAEVKSPILNEKLARRTSAGVEIISGPLKLVVRNPVENDKSVSLYDVWLDRDTDGKFSDDELISKKPVDAFLRLQQVAPGPPDKENWLRDAGDDKGMIFRATLDSARKVTIEENGPLRAVVRIDGWHVSESGRKAFKFTIRIHVRKNSGELKFQHTFVATEDVNTNFVREMGMTFPFDGSGISASVGTPTGSVDKNLNSSDALSVYGIGDPRFYHFKSYKTEIKRVHAYVDWLHNGSWTQIFKGIDPPGWAVLNNDRGGAAVAFRDFRNLHPKELRIDGSGVISVYLWPERGGKCLDLRRRSQTLDRRFVENGMDPNGGRGLAKTHEWLIDYSPKKITDVEARNMALAVNEPIIPFATPEYYAKTKVFGEFLPDNENDFPKLNAALRFAVRYMRELRGAFGFDGMIDWGDISISGVGSKDHINRNHPEGIPFRGYTGWNNNDFGLCHGLFLHYLRTGDRKTFLDAEAMAMHVMDVDTEHYNPEAPETIGKGHRHDQQHWGNGFRSYCYAPDASIDLYLLTGNRRAYDVAKEMADNIGGYGRYMVLRFWEISGDPKYKKRAEELLNDDIKPQDRAGWRGWPFAYLANFRFNSYDGTGYVFYDSILPNEKLKNAFIQAIKSRQDAYIIPWRLKGHPCHALFALGHKYDPTPRNTEVLKIMVWARSKGVPKDATVFNLPENAASEDVFAVNDKTMKYNRNDIVGLYYLLGLPYVFARLKDVGVTEEDCLNYKWKWVDAPSFVEVLDSSKIKNPADSGTISKYEWHYYNKNESPSYRPDKNMPKYIVDRWNKAVKRHRMYEDGKLIGPHPYARSQMSKYGKIGWCRRLSSAITFTTSDNSDPRKNGRKYELVYVSEQDCKWRDVDSFKEVFDPMFILPYGKAWAYQNKNDSPERVHLVSEKPEDKKRWEESLARHNFFENGKSLGNYGEATASSMRKARGKGWIRNQNLLVFTVLDGSDPRTNGKKYTLTYKRGE